MKVKLFPSLLHNVSLRNDCQVYGRLQNLLMGWTEI